MKNIWEYWRPVYKLTWALAQKSSYNHFVEYIKNEGRVILDIGTGTGEYIKDLPKNNYYIFTDIDKKALRKAKKVAEKNLNHGSYEIQVLDAFEAIKKYKEVDIVSIIHVISVIPSSEELIKTIADCLKPGGILVVYINRLSKNLEWLCNPLSRALGFRLIDIRQAGLDWHHEKTGALNECYIYQKISKHQEGFNNSK